MLMDNQEVVETVVALTSSEKEAGSLKPLGEWLSTIFHANEQIEFLFKVAVQAEANYPST
jgi:predicted cation transporter